jgi:hypothetical protein
MSDVLARLLARTTGRMALVQRRRAQPFEDGLEPLAVEVAVVAPPGPRVPSNPQEAAEPQAARAPTPPVAGASATFQTRSEPVPPSAVAPDATAPALKTPLTPTLLPQAAHASLLPPAAGSMRPAPPAPEAPPVPQPRVPAPAAAPSAALPLPSLMPLVQPKPSGQPVRDPMIPRPEFAAKPLLPTAAPTLEAVRSDVATAAPPTRAPEVAAAREVPAPILARRAEPPAMPARSLPAVGQASPLASPPTAATATSTVEVHIGTVEIRAVPPAAARTTATPAAPVRREGAQPMALEDYMARRRT